MKTQGKVWIIYDTENKSQSKPLSVVQTQVVLLSIQPHNLGRFFLWTPGWSEWISVKDFLESDQKYFVTAQPPKPQEGKEVPPSRKPSKAILDEETVTSALNSLTETNSPYTQVMAEPPLRDKVDYGYYHQDFHGNDLDLSKIRKIKPERTKKKAAARDDVADAERRRELRHDFRIEVVLVSKVRTFRTSSKNISLSGTMLEKEIPKDFLNKHFDLIIVNPFESDVTKSRLLFRAKIVGDLRDPRRLMFIEQDVDMTARLEALLKAYVAYQSQIKKSTG